MKSTRAVCYIFIGTVLGLWALYGAARTVPIVLIAGLLVLGPALIVLGSRLLPKFPRVAVILMHLASPMSIGVVALSVAATTWLSTWLPDWLALTPGSPLAEDADTVKGVLIGAVGALFAGLWLDEVEDEGSRIWPGHWVEKAFAKTYTAEANTYLTPALSLRNSRFQAAAFLGKAGKGVSGWGLAASLKRLELLDEARAIPPAPAPGT